MTTQEKASLVLGVVLAFGLVGGAAFLAESCHKTAGTQAEHNAAVESGVASAHQESASQSDAVAKDLQAKLEGQAKDLDRLSKERDGLLKRLASKPVPRVDPANPVPGSDLVDALEAAVSERDEVIAKDAEVIAAQDGRIKGLEALNGQLVTSRDEWKATAEARERQAIAQEAATKAWKDAVRSSKWSGRVQGFAAGVAVGFIGGKL